MQVITVCNFFPVIFFLVYGLLAVLPYAKLSLFFQVFEDAKKFPLNLFSNKFFLFNFNFFYNKLNNNTITRNIYIFK